MKDKVLVTLVVPSLEGSYEVLLPVFMKVSQIIPLLAKGLQELTQSRYVSSGTELLCSGDRELVFEDSHTIQECGVMFGDTLYLI